MKCRRFATGNMNHPSLLWTPAQRYHEPLEVIVPEVLLIKRMNQHHGMIGQKAAGLKHRAGGTMEQLVAKLWGGRRQANYLAESAQPALLVADHLR